MFEEGSVDDSDSFLHAVRDILSSPSSKQDPLAVSNIIIYCTLEQLSHPFHFL